MVSSEIGCIHVSYSKSNEHRLFSQGQVMRAAHDNEEHRTFTSRYRCYVCPFELQIFDLSAIESQFVGTTLE